MKDILLLSPAKVRFYILVSVRDLYSSFRSLYSRLSLLCLVSLLLSCRRMSYWRLRMRPGW